MKILKPFKNGPNLDERA